VKGVGGGGGREEVVGRRGKSRGRGERKDDGWDVASDGNGN